MRPLWRQRSCWQPISEVSTHGVSRLPIYVKRVELGLVNVSGKRQVVSDAGCAVLMEADGSLGAVVGIEAMELCIRKAREFGVGVVAVRNSTHFGIAGYYAELATNEGMIGFAATNAAPRVMPFGGIDPVIGSNPFALAFPRGDEPPIILDMATSTVTVGTLLLAAAAGQIVPEGWGVDVNGKPTTDR